ncbi:MAG: hypothetical protein WAK23_16250, partial [Terriglobales bacterium]
MKNSKTRVAVLLLSTLGLLTSAYGQTGATSSTESLTNSPLERRPAQILPHSGQAAASDRQTQSPPTRLDRLSRDQAPHKALPDSQRPPGAAVAAERYVFGRMDLATSDSPG